MTLDQLPLNRDATITAIDWACLAPGEEVEPIHGSGWFTRDPIACRIGRMTVAIRKAHAAAISVEPTA
jgi:ferrous iron transport protein A